jgi:hypothetical protein
MKIHADALRELDRLENEARPTVHISSDELDFGDIYFLEPVTRSVVLENTGTVHIQFCPTNIVGTCSF